MAGSEVAQMYISQPKASVQRPVKELKAFQKIFLKQTENQTVKMALKVQDMAYYNDKTNSWIVEPGEFVIHIATSSADIKSSIAVKVIN